MEYFIKLNVALGLLYLLYHFFLSKDVRLNVRRIYLLAIIPMAALLPFVEIPVFAEAEVAKDIQGYVYSLAPITIDNEIEEPIVETVVSQSENRSIDWTKILWYAYFGITLFLLVRLVQVAMQIVWQIKRSPTEKRGAYVFVPDSNVTLPYSFFNYIFVGQQTDGLGSTEVDHEIAHARQLHSVDRIFAEITIAFLWINPFIYFWRKALVELHEFLADRAAMHSTSDWERYSRQLVSSVYQESQLQLTSNFSAQILKKRIKMITRDKKANYWNIASLSTSLIMVILAFACSKNNFEVKEHDVVIVKGGFATPYQPAFYGSSNNYEQGKKELSAFFSENLKYPELAIQNKIEGTVVIAFTITIDGNLIKPQVVRKVHPLLDAEALRLVNSIPKKWTVGNRNGKPTEFTLNTSISFSMHDGKPAAQNSVASLGWCNEDFSECIQGRAYSLSTNLARFAGGPLALKEYAKKNESPVFDALAEPVSARFVVKANGEIGEIQIWSDCSEGVVNKLVAIIRRMPKWTPGTINGKPVDSWEGISIPFAAAYATE